MPLLSDDVQTQGDHDDDPTAPLLRKESGSVSGEENEYNAWNVSESDDEHDDIQTSSLGDQSKDNRFSPSTSVPSSLLKPPISFGVSKDFKDPSQKAPTSDTSDAKRSQASSEYHQQSSSAGNARSIQLDTISYAPGSHMPVYGRQDPLGSGHDPSSGLKNFIDAWCCDAASAVLGSSEQPDRDGHEQV